MSRVAIYPGSFDPITLAHQNILAQAREVFDQVIVVVGHNGAKRSMFTQDERALQVGEVVGDDTGLVYTPPPRECITDTARAVGARFIVRGIRGPADIEAEAAYRAFVTGNAQGSIDVVYFMTPGTLRHVSSTAVREILGLDGPRHRLAGWLDPRVTRLLNDQISNKG